MIHLNGFVKSESFHIPALKVCLFWEGPQTCNGPWINNQDYFLVQPINWLSLLQILVNDIQQPEQIVLLIRLNHLLKYCVG